MLCAQVLIETVYRYVVATDAESLRILDDVIILFVHANPDGMDLCADWYMRKAKPSERSLGGLPRLYEKYAGHDNNRDFYAHSLAETKNLNRVMFRDWFPQIVYDHHQTGPAGAVVFVPPCRDPNNYQLHPLVLNGIEQACGSMVQRLIMENKPGITDRTGAGYSTWWNGGLCTACQFHNMIGFFTETIGGPTPSQIPLIASKLLPTSDYLYPITPQEWHFKQSLEYSVSGNKGVLDYAARSRRLLLHNIWLMGKEMTDRGMKDSWTISPKIVAAAGGRGGLGGVGGGGGGGGGFGGGGGAGATVFAKLFRDPAKRDPRGYILPSDQPDFLTATKFINTLLGNGCTVHKATAEFTAGGKKYPAGSFVVKTAQPFRPHVLDMFEPQDHPDDIPYPGAPPTAPYDAAGWTLAYTMGVKFDRILDAFEGPFEVIKEEELETDAGEGHRGGERNRLLLRHAAERCLPGSQPPVEVWRNGRAVAGSDERERSGCDLPGRDVLRQRQAIHQGDPGKVGRGDRYLVRRYGDSCGFECQDSQARPRRVVGSVRRVDAGRVDPADSRTIRIPHANRLRERTR